MMVALTILAKARLRLLRAPVLRIYVAATCPG
jgi:hypothetical protein